MFDLVVIGAGPAGSAAAFRAACQGRRVVLLERGRYPRDKVCGEFFSPEALPLLEEIAPGLAAPAPVIRRAAIAGRDFALPAAARGITRRALDHALFQAAAAAGADARELAPVAAVSREFDAWRLRLGGGDELVARHLIVACGRWWRIAGLPAPRTSHWLGLKGHFRGSPSPPHVELFRVAGGYCGLAPVGAGLVNACALVRHAPGTSPPLLTALLAPLYPHLQPASDIVSTFPVALGPRQPIYQGALFAGDASGFIDPFTGDGMARALLGGDLAARCLDDPAAYARACRAAQPALRVAALLRPLLVRVPLPSSLGPALVRATRWRAPLDAVS